MSKNLTIEELEARRDAIQAQIETLRSEFSALGIQLDEQRQQSAKDEKRADLERQLAELND